MGTFREHIEIYQNWTSGQRSAHLDVLVKLTHFQSNAARSLIWRKRKWDIRAPNRTSGSCRPGRQACPALFVNFTGLCPKFRVARPTRSLLQFATGWRGPAYGGRDTRLNRDAAIKVFVDRFTGPFDREARDCISESRPRWLDMASG